MVNSREYFDAKAETWDVDQVFGAHNRAAAFLGGAAKGARVLDIGTGTGIMVQAYLDAGAAWVTGLDVSPRMLEVARRKFPQDNVELLCTDACGFAPVEPYDCAVIYNAYPHFEEPRALVAAVAAALRPGGRFIVAHGMGRAELNDHHAQNAPEVHSLMLRAPEIECKPWEKRFRIDTLVDRPDFYCFGGYLREDREQGTEACSR